MPYFYHFVDKVYDAPTTTLRKLTLDRTRSLQAMPRQVKSGYLLHFKKRMLGRSWREMYVVLYEDSSLVWFRDRDAKLAEGSLRLLDSPDLIAAGQFVCRVPNPPSLQPGCCNNLAIAISSSVKKKAQWFLTKSQMDLIDWMKAINSTLPPPPPPPLEDWNINQQNFLNLENPPKAMNPLITSNSQALLSRSNTTQLQLPLHVGSKTTLRSSEFKQNGPELRRCSLSSPCLFPTDENSLPSSMDLRTSGGEELMFIAGLASGWGTGNGWLHSYEFCGTCALLESNMGTSPLVHSMPGFDDEPDCDVGDTDVGADFGDFGF